MSFDNMINGFGNAFNAFVGEPANKKWDLVGQDLNKAAEAMRKDGIIAGGLELRDAFSVGGAADRWSVALGLVDEEDTVMREGIAAGASYLSGDIIGLLYNGYEALNAKPSAGAAGGQQSSSFEGASEAQSVESPQDKKAGMKGALKAEAKDKAREAMNEAKKEEFLRRARERAGDNVVYPLPGESPVRDGRVEIEIGIGWGPGKDYERPIDNGDVGNMEKKRNEVEAEIDALLANPNISFEDFIFKFMLLNNKAQRLEVKSELKALRDDSRSSREVRDSEKQALAAQESAVIKQETEAQKSQDPDQIGKAKQARAELEAAKVDSTEKASDSAESRAERMEAIKEMMQKLTQMEQAMSNVLNSQHQAAMNAIGNIR
jgi:hypothetical protein